MNITHVIRGDDHLANTPKQILVYKALGLAIPTFAHLFAMQYKVEAIHGPLKEKNYLQIILQNGTIFFQ